jgi:membrane dipeptidase
MNDTELKIKAASLHASTTVVDAHHDILLDVIASRQQGKRGRINQYWGPKLRNGGVNVQVLPVYVDSYFLPELALRRTLTMVEAFHADFEDDNSLVTSVTSYSQMEKALSDGKIAAFLGLEGAEGLGNDIELFHTFYRLGMRVISLTWNRRTAFADGTGEQATGSGLTQLGFAAVREMERLHIVVDVSHINEVCFFDVVETTQQPIIASHSNAKGIYNHPRNLTDDQIRALADNGGVMGLLMHPGMIDPEDHSISRAVDHLAYVADLVGIDHVGIGSDFMEDALAKDMEKVSTQESMVKQDVLLASIKNCGRIDELPHLTEELVRRGFSDDDIRKILGENFLRVFRKVLVDEVK